MRNAIVSLAIQNAMRPPDTTVQRVVRFEEFREGRYFCFQSYQDRELVASRHGRCSAMEHNLEDETLRAWNVHSKVLGDCSPPYIWGTHEPLQERPTSATLFLPKMLN